jgi:Uma2 family endonuclease
MSTLSKSYLTPEQYLEIERKAEFKSEYYQGEMFAMSGARRAHNLIAANAVASLHRQLRGRPCEVYPGDMRVRVGSTGLYAYPDLVIICGDPKFLDNTFDTLLNPTVIVEILSESTQAYDRGEKFEMYSSLDSLAEYLMISSLRVRAELFARQTDGRWLLTGKSGLEDSLELQSVGCHLLLSDLYEKIEFALSAPGSRRLES